MEFEDRLKVLNLIYFNVTAYVDKAAEWILEDQGVSSNTNQEIELLKALHLTYNIAHLGHFIQGLTAQKYEMNMYADYFVDRVNFEFIKLANPYLDADIRDLPRANSLNLLEYIQKTLMESMPNVNGLQIYQFEDKN